MGHIQVLHDLGKVFMCQALYNTSGLHDCTFARPKRARQQKGFYFKEIIFLVLTQLDLYGFLLQLDTQASRMTDEEDAQVCQKLFCTHICQQTVLLRQIERERQNHKERVK